MPASSDRRTVGLSVAVQRTGSALRLSCGQMTFDVGMGLQERSAICEMWVNRLRGFANLRTDEYLRDSVPSSGCTIGRRRLTDLGLRRLCRVLFPAQRLARLMALDFSLELLDGHTRREAEGFTTSCTAVALLGRCIIRQSVLRMSIVHRAHRLVWGEAVEDRLPRADWRYVVHRKDESRISFVRTSSCAATQGTGPPGRRH